jgi:SAM-dependent methyltransferase
LIRADEVAHLACPDCTGEALNASDIREEKGALMAGCLTCDRCGSTYGIKGGVPWLLPAPLREEAGGAARADRGEWRLWSERLEGFKAWRVRTWQQEPAEEVRRSRLAAEARREAFAAFCGVVAGRALEVGCGDGYLSRASGLRVGEYWGVDPMPGAQAPPPFRLVAGVGERLPFRSGTFDAVMAKDSLHHFQSPAVFLEEACRVMADGGRLLICQGVEPEGEEPRPGLARRFLSRVARAASLLASGDLPELRRRAGRMMRSGRRDEGSSEEPRHYLWHLTREEIESEVDRKFRARRSRMEGNCVYLEAEVREGARA